MFRQILIEEFTEGPDVIFKFFRKARHIGRLNPTLRFAHWNAKTIDSTRKKDQGRKWRPSQLAFVFLFHGFRSFEAEGNDLTKASRVE